MKEYSPEVFICLLIVLILLIIYLFEYIRRKKEESISSKEDISEEKIECRTVVSQAERMLGSDGYLQPSDIKEMYSRICNSYEFCKTNHSFLITPLGEKIKYFQAEFKRLAEYHNQQYLKGIIDKVRNTVGNVENAQLDEQQLSCIVKPLKNHLVVAGAGSGKTTTIIGKIKYLLDMQNYSPERILVLSYTNVSAKEMSERIKKETGKNIDAMTFHKLGVNILTAVEGKRPKVTTLNMGNFISASLERLAEDEGYQQTLISYLLHSRVQEKSEFDFKNSKEYTDYLKLNPPTTLKSEVVKSYGEMDIANFLFTHNIEYIYEKLYETDTNTEQYGQYTPDFYLPKYNVYIEYYGIDRNGDVPSYFTSRHGKSPSEEYNDAIEWKRQLHQSNGTVLIELFSYNKTEGNLESVLSAKLSELDIPLQQMSQERLWNIVTQDNSILTGLSELIQSVIGLIKSNGYTISDVRKLNTNPHTCMSISDLLTLVEPILSSYNAYLQKHNEIDFDDMIFVAKRYIEEGKFASPYTYVIVDEYQDIAKSRFLLLKALRQSRDYKLFCVGDDWQSIYRFSGSDISYILNFENYWGECEVSKIERTYRFAQPLIDVSSYFVTRNPLQIKKDIKGRESNTFAVREIIGYTEKNTIDFMVEKLRDLPANSSVYLIGRYKADSKLLTYNNDLITSYDKEHAVTDVKLRGRNDLSIKYITAHKSKGLQADYVFIINNKHSKMGFPSQIQDSPIFELLLSDTDSYPFAEERRLFYVALTRAKIKTYLLVVQNKESVFYSELKAIYGDKMKSDHFECPLCGGRLIKKSGRYGEFIGCSNYSKGCRYTKK